LYFFRQFQMILPLKQHKHIKLKLFIFILKFKSLKNII